MKTEGCLQDVWCLCVGGPALSYLAPLTVTLNDSPPPEECVAQHSALVPRLNIFHLSGCPVWCLWKRHTHEENPWKDYRWLFFILLFGNVTVLSETAIALLAVHVMGLKQWFKIMPGGIRANYFPRMVIAVMMLLYIYTHAQTLVFNSAEISNAFKWENMKNKSPGKRKKQQTKQ